MGFDTNFNENVTIIIKTFHRGKILRNLLKSLDKNLPEVSVVIFDDGYIKSRVRIKDYKNLRVTKLGFKNFDVGLSKGRNELLKYVETPYFFLFDDDFEVTPESNLETALNLLINNKLDILAGNLVNIHKLNSIISVASFLKRKFRLFFLKEPEANTNVLPKIFNLTNGCLTVSDISISNEEIIRCSAVPNFFIASTAKVIELGGWQPESLKLNEHGLFFMRAFANDLKIGFTKVFYVNHIRYIPLIYKIFRMRSFSDSLEFEYNKLGINLIRYI
jgi:glycosyltransferase involved in cell wall biosynthesis